MNLQIRPAQEEDLNFIRANWLNSFRMMGYPTKNIPSQIFWTYHPRVVERIRQSPMTKVWIASPEDHPEQCLGFLVASCVRMSDKDHQKVLIHYIFVKSEFQKLGIAKKLVSELKLQEGDEVSYTHITRLWICKHRESPPETTFSYCSHRYCQNPSAEQWISQKFPKWTYNPYLI